jgi:hypothetical protein
VASEDIVDEDQEDFDPKSISNFRCDRCGSRAYFMTVFDSGDLYFCRHHFIQNEEALREMAYYVIDESSQLAAKS